MIMCKCTNGILYPQNRENLPEGDVWIEILKDNRTLRQNNYMWLCFEKIAEFTGDSKGSVHDDMLRMFGIKAYEVNTKTGEIKERIKRTSELNKKEFADFMDAIIKFFAEEYGLVLPADEY